MKRIALAALAALALAGPVEARTHHHHKAASASAHHTAKHADRHKAKKSRGDKAQRRKAHHAKVSAKAHKHAARHAQKHKVSAHRHGHVGKVGHHVVTHGAMRHRIRHGSTHRSRRHAVRTHASHARHQGGASHATPTYRTPHYDAPADTGGTGGSFNNAFKDIRPSGENH